MIKTKYGKLEVNGSVAELMADLHVIVRGLYENVLLEGMTEQEATEELHNVIRNATNTSESKTQEDDTEELLEELQDLIDELGKMRKTMLNKKKGKGEE